jgi:ribosomal protein L11 methyltransferase
VAWLLLRLETHQEEVAALEALLHETGAVAITMEDNADQPLLEPGVGETPLWRQTRLTAMYPAGTDMAAVLQALPAAALSPASHRVEILEEKDWEREWMRHYGPMRFGERLWICPSWQAPPDPAAVNLLLDPGLAFGTGTHPTTALCLGELADMALDGATAVDYGCGSGILAVAALKLGVDRVLAVDNDPQALAATRENAARNLIPERALQICLPEEVERGAWAHRADVVVANILAGPLAALSATLLQFLKPGGTLLLSGLLESQAHSLCDHYAPHLALQICGEREGWVCLRGRLPPQ